MKLKKYIKLKEEPQEEPMSEREQELYNSLIERVRQNAAEHAYTKKKVSLWKILTPVLSVAAAIAVTLTCVFSLRSEKDFLYSEDFIVSEDTTFSALQENIKYFDLTYVEATTENIKVSYDSRNKDKLFYRVSSLIENSYINFDVVINDKYDYKFEIDFEILSKQLNDYTINYCKESLRGKPQINYKGWIKVQTETVYFDYVQIPALGDDAFFESIQQIIKVK